jgi:hypothetical protein
MFDATPDKTVPQHRWFEELTQYRLKVRQFSRCPAEFTVQQIRFDKDLERYQRAYENGNHSCGMKVGKRVKNDEPRSAESLERSQRRAKTHVRLNVVELAPTALVTFTTRETMSLDALLWCWQYFARLMRDAAFEFEYVAVPERHPSNPDHLHLHVAYRGRTPFNVLRRFWHMALEARHGRKLRCILRGTESPGNVDVQTIKARESVARIRKIARYISKYITKDLISEFNKKRYWPSKGIDLAGAQVFWLTGLTQFEAIREACTMLGQWDEALDLCPQKLFRPSDRVAWCAIDPAATPPPPF